MTIYYTQVTNIIFVLPDLFIYLFILYENTRFIDQREANLICPPHIFLVFFFYINFFFFDWKR